MKYMQVSGNDRNSGLCSDDACPCGSPGATIPRGKGYVYVSKEVVDFRMDCPTEAEAKIKIQRMSAQTSSVIFVGAGVFSPIVMCVQGAKKRGLDLEVAAADARHWWNTGQVPLRPTPLARAKPASTAEVKKELISRPATPTRRCPNCDAVLYGALVSRCYKCHTELAEDKTGRSASEVSVRFWQARGKGDAPSSKETTLETKRWWQFWK